MDTYDEFVELQHKFGGSKYMIDEVITQAEHSLQAAYFGYICGAPEDFIVALLVHDVGQLSDKNLVGDANALHGCHDKLGYEWLKARGLPSYMCDIVNYHTIAKVVMCMKDPTYFNHLSKASQISYLIQKEQYENSEKMEEFRKSPNFYHCILARMCDDMAKIRFLKVPNFGFYKDMFKRVSETRGNPASNINEWCSQIENMHTMMLDNSLLFEKHIRISTFRRSI